MSVNPTCLRSAKIQCAAVVGLILTGCAMGNRDNTVLLSKLDEKVSPNTTWERVALAPIMMPAATGALLVDGMVIHPVRVIPKAGDDVYELYWQPRDETEFRQSLLLIPRAVATPPTFLGAWCLRATFDISD